MNNLCLLSDVESRAITAENPTGEKGRGGLATDASKCAFAALAPALFAAGCPMVDCQTRSDHMARFGAAFMPREEYLRRLSAAVKRGVEMDWKGLVPGDPCDGIAESPGSTGRPPARRST